MDRHFIFCDGILGGPGRSYPSGQQLRFITPYLDHCDRDGMLPDKLKVIPLPLSALMTCSSSCRNKEQVEFCFQATLSHTFCAELST